MIYIVMFVACLNTQYLILYGCGRIFKYHISCIYSIFTRNDSLATRSNQETFLKDFLNKFEEKFPIKCPHYYMHNTLIGIVLRI